MLAAGLSILHNLRQYGGRNANFVRPPAKDIKRKDVG
jgi:hypothetical protein